MSENTRPPIPTFICLGPAVMALTIMVLSMVTHRNPVPLPILVVIAMVGGIGSHYFGETATLKRATKQRLTKRLQLQTAIVEAQRKYDPRISRSAFDR